MDDFTIDSTNRGTFPNHIFLDFETKLIGGQVQLTPFSLNGLSC
jgi:hypothetical protein